MTLEEIELDNYRLVNQAKTLSELVITIRNIGAKTFNQIQGSHKVHDATKMAENCLKLINAISTERLSYCQTLTRNYGIRQQAMMLCFYNKF